MKRREKIVRGVISTVLSLALATSLISPFGAGRARAELDHTATISNPQFINDDEGMAWDCVYFGRYPQSDATGETKEPIKWMVLSVEGDEAFLMAEKALDVMPYNTTFREVTWETCTMRSWLNGYPASTNVEGEDYSGAGTSFLDKAFTEEEKDAIFDTTVVNDDNPTHGTDGGNDTTDKVYLLSRDEAVNKAYGFPSSLVPTYDEQEEGDGTYGRYRGVTPTKFAEENPKNSRSWCLRTPGRNQKTIIILNTREGQASLGGDGGVECTSGYLVRPILRLNLAHTNPWSHAGTIRKAGNSAVQANPNATVAMLKANEKKDDGTAKSDDKEEPKDVNQPDATKPSQETNQPEQTAKAAKSAKVGQVKKLSAKNAKKKVLLTWKKAKRAKGYEVTYSKNAKFRAGKKTKDVVAGKAAKPRTKIGKLAKNTTYYFKVRAYRGSGTAKQYGSYGKTVKIKTT